MNMKVEYDVDYQCGGQRGTIGTYTRKGEADAIITRKREENVHRDDDTRAQVRPCPIWTQDGTWKTYTSVPTHYRIVKVTREVIDTDEDFRPHEGCF
jgi:hypothetical protein